MKLDSKKFLEGVGMGVWSLMTGALAISSGASVYQDLQNLSTKKISEAMMLGVLGIGSGYMTRIYVKDMIRKFKGK